MIQESGPSRELPIIRQIDHAFLKDAGTDKTEPSGQDQHHQQHSVILQPGMNLSLESFNRNLRSSHWEMQAAGVSAGVFNISSTKDASFLLMKQSPDGVQRQQVEVSQLPAYGRSAKVTMKLPEPDETAVTLILNKGMQPRNSFAQSLSDQLPVIVRRPITSLRMTQVQYTKIAGSSDGSDNKRRIEIGTEDEDEEKAQRRSRRKRIE